VTAGSRGCLSVACFVKGADPSIVGSSAPNRQIFTNGTHESPFATAFGATLSFHIDLMAFGVAASVRFAFLDSCRSEVSKTYPSANRIIRHNIKSGVSWRETERRSESEHNRNSLIRFFVAAAMSDVCSCRKRSNQ
jgi:hypothetical protein